MAFDDQRPADRRTHVHPRIENEVYGLLLESPGPKTNYELHQLQRKLLSTTPPDPTTEDFVDSVKYIVEHTENDTWPDTEVRVIIARASATARATMADTLSAEDLLVGLKSDNPKVKRSALQLLGEIWWELDIHNPTPAQEAMLAELAHLVDPENASGDINEIAEGVLKRILDE